MIGASKLGQRVIVIVSKEKLPAVCRAKTYSGQYTQPVLAYSTAPIKYPMSHVFAKALMHKNT